MFKVTALEGEGHVTHHETLVAAYQQIEYLDNCGYESTFEDLEFGDDPVHSDTIKDNLFIPF